MDDDCILRRALIRHIESQYHQWGKDYDVLQVLGDIETFPSADFDCDKKRKEVQ